MIDKTIREQMALEATLQSLSEITTEIGFSKPLNRYSRTEALMLIEGVVTGYQDHFLEKLHLEHLENQSSFEGVPFDV